MARVIIVSNRLPVIVKKVDGKLTFERGTGGMAIGLSSYMRSGNNRWVGWPGIASDELTDKERQQIVSELRKFNCAPVFLTKKQIDDFYSGFSNTILWPLFHNLPVPKPKARGRMWRAYRAVNKAFSEEVVRLSQPGSRVWAQDYQLLLLPAMIRALSPSLNIGFFMHIPFPTPDTYAKLPEGRQLLIGMLGADLVGFHTRDYVNNFLDTCDALQVGQSGHKQVILGARTVRISDFPMGIDYKKYAQAGKEKEVKAAVRTFKNKYRGLKIIVAVDRMDPSKGLVERLEAYREFLRRNPKYCQKVILAMVAEPSRTDVAAYKRLKKRLDALVVEINHEFGVRGGWQPIDYMDQGQPFHGVTALFQLADIAFITPIRDGMNLVAKEYVASRGRNGILILSETTGAAQELTDALLVNPKQPETVVAALEQAMHMRKRESNQRFKRMQKQLSTNTVQHWAGSFMKTLQQPLPGTPVFTYTLNKRRQKELVQVYQTTGRRLILLDYDGTLTPLTANFADAEPSKELPDLLRQLSADERNTVVIISGRSKQDLDNWFKDLNVTLVAEHGALIKPAGHKTWQVISDVESGWKKTVKPILEKYTALTPRSTIEEKQYSLVWHYRQSPAYAAQKNLVILQRLLKPILKPLGLKAFAGSKILEIKDPNISKGSVIERWLKDRPDFVLTIGDDFTDEDMFETVGPEAYSVKVGRGSTAAHYRLADSAEVLKLLRQLSR